MFINEYGSREDPTIILLAPMMVTGSDLYQLMKPHLEGSYHIIAPDQGGYAHCACMAAETEKYVWEIEAFMGRADQ